MGGLASLRVGVLVQMKTKALHDRASTLNVLKITERDVEKRKNEIARVEGEEDALRGMIIRLRDEADVVSFDELRDLKELLLDSMVLLGKMRAGLNEAEQRLAEHEATLDYHDAEVAAIDAELASRGKVYRLDDYRKAVSS